MCHIQLQVLSVSEICHQARKGGIGVLINGPLYLSGDETGCTHSLD